MASRASVWDLRRDASGIQITGGNTRSTNHGARVDDFVVGMNKAPRDSRTQKHQALHQALLLGA